MVFTKPLHLQKLEVTVVHQKDRGVLQGEAENYSLQKEKH